MASVRISVVIVTYNRPAEANKAILSLLNQSSKPFEIILIDDASDPPFILEEITSKINIIRFDEEIGLSAARNYGIKTAKGDYVAFIDDDCIATKTWIEEVQKAIKTGGDILGGPLKPRFNVTPPKWWSEDDLGYFAGVGNSASQQIWGANMIFKREIFQDIGFFDSRIGRQKGKLLSGEDSELISRGKGIYTILFVTKAVVFHSVKTERLSMSYIIRWSYNSGKSQRFASGPGKLAFYYFIKAVLLFLNPFAGIKKSGRVRQIAVMAEQIGAVI